MESKGSMNQDLLIERKRPPTNRPAAHDRVLVLQLAQLCTPPSQHRAANRSQSRPTTARRGLRNLQGKISLSVSSAFTKTRRPGCCQCHSYAFATIPFSAT